MVDSVLLAWQPIGMFRSFGLTQKNQKVKAAPSGLLRFAAGGKWMKLASLKQHPFLFRPPRRSASRPSAEGRSLSSHLGHSCSKAGSFPPRWNLLFRSYRSLSESEPFFTTTAVPELQDKRVLDNLGLLLHRSQSFLSDWGDRSLLIRLGEVV